MMIQRDRDRAKNRARGATADPERGGIMARRREKVEQVDQWRQRRSCRGELVQWDTRDHDWLEGGEKLY